MKIEQVKDEFIKKHQNDFVNLLMNVVEYGGSIGFIPPISHQKAADFWQDVCAQVKVGTLCCVVVIGDNGDVVGCSLLFLSDKDNGLHRAEVGKVMVHSTYRRRGLAKKMMLKLHDVAKECGRSLLVLDTREEEPSNGLYLALGYKKVGMIPDYAQNEDGSFHNTIYYYKKL